MTNIFVNKRSFGEFLIPLFLILFLFINMSAQNYQPTPNDTLRSITIQPDNKVTMKIYAPSAQEVKIGGSDIPDKLRNVEMVKQTNGVWEGTVGPLEPGSYRYTFMVDKVSVLDPRNPSTSESNTNSWSLFYVPGAEFMNTKDVPHGAVSEVTYFSKSLNRFRRMHVYTPPGYELDDQKYPVFYLLHGAFDCDDSWSSVGRAGFIVDNLIAEKKAVPMVIVMPAGHTGPFIYRASAADGSKSVDEFIEDFNKDIKPYIEKNYRVLPDRINHAIAGLSMGGMHTLHIGIPNLMDYAYLGVFSSGFIRWNRNANEPTWEEQNVKYLDDPNMKNGLKLIWFATGKEDFLLNTSRESVVTLKKHGFEVTYKETEGAHTWENWRKYLYEFAQLLFKD